MADLKKEVAKAVAGGLERPEALVEVLSAGVDCTEKQFREAYREAQANANAKPKAKAKKKK